MGRVTTDCKYWKCPSCGEVLEKGGLGMFMFPGDDTDKILGTSTCSKCGAGFSQSDVYGGAYDFAGERAPTTSPPEEAPASLSVVLFREGAESPDEPRAYCEQVVQERYGVVPCPGIDNWYLVGWMGEPSAAQAAVAYARNRETGQIPDLGSPADEFESTGPDGAQVAALFFWNV